MVVWGIPIIRRKIFTIIILSSFLIGFLSTVKAEYNEYISDVGNVNKIFDDYEAKDIAQGTSGEFKVTFKNPYELSMNNVSLKINIIGYLFKKTWQDVDANFKNPPIFKKANSPDSECSLTSDSLTSIINWKYIENNVSKPISLIIKTNSNTPYGDYLIRFELKFNYSGLKDKEIIMRSKDYIDNEDWQFALETGMDPPNTNNINLTSLGIDGIIPNSGFEVVKKEDNKGFIPSFEMLFLISAITITIFIMKIRKIIV